MWVKKVGYGRAGINSPGVLNSVDVSTATGLFSFRTTIIAAACFAYIEEYSANRGRKKKNSELP